MAAGDDPEETVRRADPDRWLASRFVADAQARADLVILYAVDLELERARRVTGNPLATEIRLTWWWEAVGEILDGAPARRHPLVMALAEVVGRRGLSRTLLEAMIDARFAAIGQTGLDLESARRWADGAGGSVAVLAAGVLDPRALGEAARPAGRLIGAVSLLRQGRVGPDDALTLLGEDLAPARAAARSLPASAFPAVAAAALARRELAGARLSDIGRRTRLAWAVARGRL